MNLKVRLSLMNFFELAVWGAYLTSMGRYLSNIGMSTEIGYFYSLQGVVSIFMPAIIGIIADRWIQAQKLLGFCHLLAGLFMLLLAWYGYKEGQNASFSTTFIIYGLSVAFYMPTLSLSNSVAYNGLTLAGLDIVKDFPPIRVFGTVGFICTMWFVDIFDYQANQMQFVVSGILGFVLFLYSFTLPACHTAPKGETKSLSDAFGLKAFSLFKQKRMAIFFVFSMLLGVSLQITNSFANPYISSFGSMTEYANTFGVQHANILISLSQISETFCILLIPFFMKRYGIKNVMLIAMFAWVLRFGLFGTGNPGYGVWMLALSMIVYGVAFDFFNISGSMFVEQNTTHDIRSSAQGVFFLMTNGIGATFGTIAAQNIINHFTQGKIIDGQFYTVGNWQACWFIFAGYALVVALLFAIMFRTKKKE